MTEWTRAQVEERLESAADVMRQMPGVKPQGYFSAWPEYYHRRDRLMVYRAQQMFRTDEEASAFIRGEAQSKETE